MIDYLMLYSLHYTKESMWKFALVYNLFLHTEAAQRLKICKHEFSEKYISKPYSW